MRDAAQVGMRSWWATVSGRWRAQQAVSGWRAAGASASSLGRLAKLDNFALCGQLRWQPLRQAPTPHKTAHITRVLTERCTETKAAYVENRGG